MLTLHFSVKLLESSFLCLIINLEFILNILCDSNLFFYSCIAIWLLLHNLLRSFSSTVFSSNILLWKFSSIQKSWENFIVSTDIPNLRFYPVCWTCADGAKEIGIQLWALSAHQGCGTKVCLLVAIVFFITTLPVKKRKRTNFTSGCPWRSSEKYFFIIKISNLESISF